MRLPAFDLVRIFESDPDLLDGLDDAVAADLRMRVAVPRVWIDPGPWNPAEPAGGRHHHLGMLVLEGLLVRTMRLAGRECSEIVGPGDLIRPWAAEDEAGSVERACEWRVLTPAIVASLDERFAVRVARWPSVLVALLSRSAQRSRSLVHQATIARVRHAETRILLVLWQLADRWGRVTPKGICVPVPMTHELLAQLVCLQRPTVSAALGQLSQAGELTRLRDGTWLLHGEPPQLVAGDDAELIAV